YLHTAPGSIRFTYGMHGKPRLDGRQAKSGLHFNLAHSHDLALVAVTRLGPVGVDIELIRYLEELDELVSRFFSPREAVAFYRLPADDKPVAFFKLWTRKEAWLKATGEGIAHSLSQVEVSFLPGEPAQLLRVPHSHAPVQGWSLDNLAPAAGYAGAVAVLAPKSWVRCWHWQPEMGEVV
ncbi:MAG TPA: 4'-phosphopantetheinyl transferase superfamily protein, partial [Clostridia bacterium]|nr:4'-phosphopantetheinyl transferase superfamily protein [Clostridia bacterium]